MLMTAACNVLLALAPDVASMRVIWLINGFVQSFFGATYAIRLQNILLPRSCGPG